MKVFGLLMLTFLVSSTAFSDQESFDATSFAGSYFEAWSATQSPEASAGDIEHYLSFLSDDVGHQHLPYDPDAKRSPEGKNKMREGMTYYLGAHTEYESKLNEILPGFDVVIIKYETHVKATHPQSGEVIDQSYDTVEVLELETEKVSVVRKYSE
jgi:hypothetical protein